MLKCMFVLAAAFSLTLAGHPSGFNMTSLSFSGSGCPSGSTLSLTNNDKTAVTLVFANFIAQAGPSVASAENQKDCQLTLGARIPKGYSFGSTGVVYTGFSQLDDKVTADLTAKYYFKGNRASAHSIISGPNAGANYKHTDTFDLASSVRSPCGGDTFLYIDYVLQVNNAKNTAGSGAVTTDTIDLNLQWQQC